MLSVGVATLSPLGAHYNSHLSIANLFGVLNHSLTFYINASIVIVC